VSPEREIKLQAPPGFRLPELGGDGFVTSTRETRRIATVYLDTPDLRIARWGCSLRHRGGEGWTVKLPPSEEGSLLLRREHRFEGDEPRRPPEAAVDLLRAYVRGAPLVAVARLRTVRREVELTDELGRPLVAVTDDEVSVMDGRRVATRFREIEIELDESADPDVADGVLARLGGAGAGTVDNVPKLARALGPRADDPPEVVVPDVDTASSVLEVVRHALASSVLQLLRHDAGVRSGADPEDVHDARVATRRLRSDLRTFRDVLDPSWATSLREELAWIGRELGAVRDAEVLRDRLRGREPMLAEDDRGALERLLRGLDRRRAAAREGLLRSMHEPRYVALLDALVAAAREPSVPEEVGGLPAAGSLRPGLASPWKHLKAAADRAREDPSDETLHAARIRAKRVRYAAEALGPVFGKPARAFARAAASLQDVLGEHQDAVVASAWLRAAAVSPGRAFVAGQLAAIEAEAARSAREAWPSAWKALSRKRLRFWT
jgi:CHAD domain-containing protein